MAGTAKQRSAAWELRRLAGRINGVRVTYGKPVRAGDRTIIPVARVRVRGGFGFGSAPRDQGGDGGGGGGTFDAQPIGFIESGPQGTRYERIPEPRGRAGRLAAATAAGALTGAAVAGTAVGGLALQRVARAALRAGFRRLPGARSRSPRRLLPR
ncbi:MAG TPA: spore germination protein GerW family protein [Solirubrobacteraceae bacterium]|nr:spore germination protein GerW family protein [Solirubrobacteraceae bacterium]